MSDYHTEQRWRTGDPDTSIEAAIAISPHVDGIQAEVERYAIRAGEAGFTDAELSRQFADDGSTYRTRRAELSERNIILDSGTRRRHGDSVRNRIVWKHRRFVVSPPPLLDPPAQPARQAAPEAAGLATEARQKADSLKQLATGFRRQGRALAADEVAGAADLLLRIAAAL